MTTENKQITETPAIRFNMLDTLRGVLIIGVVLFHFAYDMYACGVVFADTIVNSPVFKYTAEFGRILFILLCGICTHLSHNNFRRALIILSGAAAISLVTFILDLLFYGEVGYMFIYCGILHFMGTAVLIYAVLDFLFRKIKLSPTILHGVCVVCAVLFILLYIMTYDIYSGKLGIGKFSLQTHSSLHGSLLGVLLGFGGFGIMSADYFPFLPWIFVFMAGSFIGVFFKENKVPAFLQKDICPPITFIGRKTLWIYLLHQPLIYGIAIGISYIVS